MRLGHAATEDSGMTIGLIARVVRQETRLSIPLRQLAAPARRVARGNLDHRDLPGSFLARGISQFLWQRVGVMYVRPVVQLATAAPIGIALRSQKLIVDLLGHHASLETSEVTCMHHITGVEGKRGRVMSLGNQPPDSYIKLSQIFSVQQESLMLRKSP